MPAGTGRSRRGLAAFRSQVYRCLGTRRDALFELADAVLSRAERVHILAELSLEPECRRGHDAVCDLVNAGQVQVARLRRALADLPPPTWPDRQIRLAADVSDWQKPDSATSPSADLLWRDGNLGAEMGMSDSGDEGARASLDYQSDGPPRCRTCLRRTRRSCRPATALP